MFFFFNFFQNLIAELRNQINQTETSSHGYQKSAFMEEYEGKFRFFKNLF